MDHDPKTPLPPQTRDLEAGKTRTTTRRDGDEETSLASVAVGEGKVDLLALEHTDPVLNAKMGLVNDVSLFRFHITGEGIMDRGAREEKEGKRERERKRDGMEADDNNRRLTRLASHGISGGCLC
jgi:hypothetical protein